MGLHHHLIGTVIWVMKPWDKSEPRILQEADPCFCLISR